MASQNTIAELKSNIADLENINNIKPSHAAEMLNCIIDTIDELFEVYFMRNTTICKCLETAKGLLFDENLDELIVELKKVLELITM